MNCNNFKTIFISRLDKKLDKQMAFSTALVTTYFALLPLEVVDYIWSFNHPWAASVIQQKFRECFEKKVCDICELFNFASFKCNLNVSMSNFSIFYKNKILKREDVFKTLTLCNCCPRHQINKPKTLQKWINTEFHETQDTDCDCQCRHLSRFICREIED